MMKKLKDMVEQAETWPEADQDELAEYARDIQARRARVYVMTDEERAAVSEGLQQAQRGEFIPDDEMLAFSEPLPELALAEGASDETLATALAPRKHQSTRLVRDL